MQKQVPDRRRIFEQNDPHPYPLPSDGRGNRQPRLSQLPKRLDTPTGGGRFSLSHPMGEGRGEGERASKSEVVFARVLSVAAAVPPAVEPGIHPPQCAGGFGPARRIVVSPHQLGRGQWYGGRVLPGGLSCGRRRHFRVQNCHSGRQDAALYGSQDGCRYSRKPTPNACQASRLPRTGR